LTIFIAAFSNVLRTRWSIFLYLPSGSVATYVASRIEVYFPFNGDKRYFQLEEEFSKKEEEEN